MLNLAICFCSPRYRVFSNPSCRFTTANTCSNFALTDDFSCSLFFALYFPLLLSLFNWDGRRLISYFIFLPCLLRATAVSLLSAPMYPASPLTVSSSPVNKFSVWVTSYSFADVPTTVCTNLLFLLECLIVGYKTRRSLLL